MSIYTESANRSFDLSYAALVRNIAGEIAESHKWTLASFYSKSGYLFNEDHWDIDWLADRQTVASIISTHDVVIVANRK